MNYQRITINRNLSHVSRKTLETSIHTLICILNKKNSPSLEKYKERCFDLLAKVHDEEIEWEEIALPFSRIITEIQC